MSGLGSRLRRGLEGVPGYIRSEEKKRKEKGERPKAKGQRPKAQSAKDKWQSPGFENEER